MTPRPTGRRNLKPNGIALFITLIILTFLFILGTLFIANASRDYIYARYVVLRNQSRYIAESGIEYAQVMKLQWDTYPRSETLEFGGGSANLTVNVTDTGATEITSIGNYSGFRNGIRATFRPDGSIITWEDL